MKIFKTLTIFQCFFLIILSYFELLSFQLWQQVLDLRGAEVSSIPFLQPHFLRYLLVLPIFVLSNISSIDANLIFNFIAILLIISVSANASKIVVLLSPNPLKNKYMVNVFIFLLITIMSLFMNGRILFSMTGLSIIILSILRWEKGLLTNFKLILFSIFGIFLCSVSSGTFLSSVIIIATWALFLRERKSLFIPFAIFFLILALLPLLSVYLMKNINFYGGGFEGLVNMLNHGMGSIFQLIGYEATFFLIILMVPITLICLAIIYYVKRYRLLLSCIFISIFAGFFGYSTMNQSLPILISLFTILIFGGFKDLALLKAKDTAI